VANATREHFSITVLPPLGGLDRRRAVQLPPVPERHAVTDSGRYWSPLDDGSAVLWSSGQGEDQWLLGDGSGWREVPTTDPLLTKAFCGLRIGHEPFDLEESLQHSAGANRWMCAALPDGTRIDVSGPPSHIKGGSGGQRFALVKPGAAGRRREVWARQMESVNVTQATTGVILTANGRWFGVLLQRDRQLWFQLAVIDARTGKTAWVAPGITSDPIAAQFAISRAGDAAIVMRTPWGLHFYRQGHLIRTLMVDSFALAPDGDRIYVIARGSPGAAKSDRVLACMTYSGHVLWASEERMTGALAVSPHGKYVGVLLGRTCRLYRADAGAAGASGTGEQAKSPTDSKGAKR